RSPSSVHRRRRRALCGCYRVFPLVSIPLASDPHVKGRSTGVDIPAKMVKLGLVLTALAAALSLPAAQGMTSRPGPSGPGGQTPRGHMNAGPDGQITRRVECGRGTRAGAAFTCTLESMSSTRLRANVAVVGGSLRTTWEPLAG